MELGGGGSMLVELGGGEHACGALQVGGSFYCGNYSNSVFYGQAKREKQLRGYLHKRVIKWPVPSSYFARDTYAHTHSYFVWMRSPRASTRHWSPLRSSVRTLAIV